MENTVIRKIIFLTLARHRADQRCTGCLILMVPPSLYRGHGQDPRRSLSPSQRLSEPEADPEGFRAGSRPGGRIERLEA